MITLGEISGSIGDQISISGDYLLPVERVLFSSAESDFQIIDKNLIRTTVPENAAWDNIWLVSDNLVSYASGDISGASGFSTGVSGYTIDKFVPAPRINSFAPIFGISGETVSVTGNCFSGITGATINNLNCDLTVDSNTGITLTIPSGNTYGKISLFGQSGVTGYHDQFFIPEVKITGFSLTSGDTGNSVGIYGQYFFDELFSDFSDSGNLYEIRVNQGESSGVGNKYYIQRSGYSTGIADGCPIITLFRNHTYYFSTMHISNSGNAFAVSERVDGAHAITGSTGVFSGLYDYSGFSQHGIAGVTGYSHTGISWQPYAQLTLYDDAPDKLYYYDVKNTGYGGSGYFRILDPSGLSVYFTSNDRGEVYSQFNKINNTTITGSIPLGAKSGPVYIKKSENAGRGSYFSTGIFIVNPGLPEIYNKGTINVKPSDSYRGGSRIVLSGKNLGIATGIKLIGSEVITYEGEASNPYGGEGTFIGGDEEGGDVVSFDLPAEASFPHDSSPDPGAGLYSIMVQTPIGDATWENSVFVMKKPINQGGGAGEIGFN